jgi:hypothetical protein
MFGPNSDHFPQGKLVGKFLMHQVEGVRESMRGEEGVRRGKERGGV